MTSNYKLLSGPSEGSVVEEGIEILDLAFEDLDNDLQLQIRDWAEDQVGKRYSLVDDEFIYTGTLFSYSLNLDEVKRDYEASWETEETEEPVDLLPVSFLVGTDAA